MDSKHKIRVEVTYIGTVDIVASDGNEAWDKVVKFEGYDPQIDIEFLKIKDVEPLRILSSEPCEEIGAE